MTASRRTTSGIGVLLTIIGLAGAVGAILDPAASTEVAMGAGIFATVGGGMALVPVARSRDWLPLRIAATFAGSSFGLLTLLLQTLLADVARAHAEDPASALPFGDDTSIEFVVPAFFWYVTMVVWMWFLSRFSPGRAGPPSSPLTPPKPSAYAGQPLQPQYDARPVPPGSADYARPATPVPHSEPDRPPAPAPTPAPAPAPASDPARRLGLSRNEWFTVGVTLLAAVLSTAGSVLANVLTR